MSSYTFKRPYFYEEDKHSKAEKNTKRMKINTNEDDNRQCSYPSFEELNTPRSWNQDPALPQMFSNDDGLSEEQQENTIDIATSECDEDEMSKKTAEDSTTHYSAKKSQPGNVDDIVDLTSNFENRDNTLFLYKLSNHRYVKGCMFKTRVFVHVRDNAEADGVLYSSKNGIALTVHQFNELNRLSEHLTDLVNNCMHDEFTQEKFHIGGNKHVSVSSDFEKVDLRSWWVPHNSKIAKIKKKTPSLFDYKPCYLEDDHIVHGGAKRCSECNPSAWKLEVATTQKTPVTEK